jgi:ABC-type polar amino acid transport system ATPase subunit
MNILGWKQISRGTCYEEMLKKLKEILQEKRREVRRGEKRREEKRREEVFFFQHNNARPHISILTNKTIAEFRWAQTFNCLVK